MLVACLCAQWCGSCREYRGTYAQVEAAFPEARFLWVDVEDQADLVDPIEVDNFPTLLIAVGDQARFLGPVLPHKETLVRLLRAQTEPDAKASADPEAHALVQRLTALAG